ncbi:NAD(P)/FAD-dependent oxidoreductase [Marinoscillum sp. 108]|uniref:NAD(P)/FAD-dependent oxidoreductase n=1 Tax=Marinoscillum sp. 108 TaxID=2653151 RepID=UPI0012F173C0|nr:FAD-dependent oxidoreductase [Marinoscillum sp. 108]VXD16889.1 Pyridine nucleotide-disulphide oxidoreductase [Marinoscillum sp. 108]
MQHIVILGNGIAGITAARHIRKRSDDRITVISGETDHFFSRTALMYIYMGHMKYEHTKPYEDWFWMKNRIDLKKGWVSSIDFVQKSLHFDSAESMTYDKLIIATGSVSNKFGWPGQDLKGVQGLYSKQDLDLMEENTKGIKHAVILGGGLIGVEMAEMLHSRHIPVTYLIREKHFWDNMLPQEEAMLIDHHLAEQGIDLRPETELDEILDDGQGQVKGVKTKSGEIIDCQFVGLTVGVSPNISLFKDAAIDTDRGILVDEFLQTNIPDVYAIGDCAQLKHPLPHRRAIEAVWYAGRMMGETIAQTITGTKTSYQPGVWFNSAKFFDIEFQNYGVVPPQCPADCTAFYWEASDKKKCIKVIFETDTKAVKGVNIFGIRNRHEVWDDWISKEKSIQFVMENLPKANFDPEFFTHWEGDIQQKFNAEFPNLRVSVRKKSFLEKILS